MIVFNYFLLLVLGGKALVTRIENNKLDFKIVTRGDWLIKTGKKSKMNKWAIPLKSEHKAINYSHHLQTY